MPCSSIRGCGDILCGYVGRGCLSEERTTMRTSVTKPDGGSIASDHSGADARNGQVPATTATITATQSKKTGSVFDTTTYAVVTLQLSIRPRW